MSVEGEHAMWTIVHRGTLLPVLPMDCPDSGLAKDEAMLVFRSEAAATAGAQHQRRWDVDAEPVLLSRVLAAEASGQQPPESGLASFARAEIYRVQGLTGPPTLRLAEDEA